MGAFNDNALRILDVAESAMESNLNPSVLTIVMGAEGGIRIIGESDWPLESLRLHYGAEMVYRVRQQGDAIRLEGRAGSRTCLFETAKLDGAARSSGGGRGSGGVSNSNGLLATASSREGASDLRRDAPAAARDRLLVPELPPTYEVIRGAEKILNTASRTSVRTPQRLLTYRAERPV